MTKLELTWVGKDEPINPEPRILIENPEYSYGDVNSGNMLIHGDNLLALKSLQQDFTGKVKCVYIDPPYNTGGAFEHYENNIEHSVWLSLMKPRIELLRSLLSEDGSIWISIDDDEQAYLKVLCDEVFGRGNFVTTVVWQKRSASQPNSTWLSDNHEFVLVYAKNKQIWRPNLLPRTDEGIDRYKNPDNDPRGVWTSSDTTTSLTSGNRGTQYARTGVSTGLYEITTPSGRVVTPAAGACWKFNEERFLEMVADNRIWFGKDGSSKPRVKRFLSEVQGGTIPTTWWARDFAGDTTDAKREIVAFNSESVFGTPKPERLIERVLTIASNPGDLVLDSFLGSGTTAAVAHKLNRRWIGVELGNHAYTHDYPRMKAVIDGEQGGISKAVNWNGGGGFKFYELAPTLLEKSKRGNFIISDKYNEEMLAHAMAKHEGYTYAPHENIIWKQGYSGDNNFIFTTTGHLSPQFIDNIGSQLGEDEYLLICAESFDTTCINRHKNIIVRPIPKMLLGRCEWGKDNYDLNIIMQEVTGWNEELEEEMDGDSDE
jgi:adenine-specific DNA-methyltransferase